MVLPSLFTDRIKQILPPDVELSGCFKGPEHAAFRVNTLKSSVGDVESYLKDQNIPFQRVLWYNDAFIIPVSFVRSLLDSPLGSEGKVYAQGLQSMLPVAVLDPQPGETILDLCAAPGSKTTQIAAHMHNEGVLVANEAVKPRFFRLKSVVELMGAKVKLMMKDGRYLRSDILYDRILVDAPCSSEGRFREDDPKSFGYWSLRKINEMAHKQKGLLLNAARLLKPGGVMVYSTCTFAPEENEAVVDWFLRKSESEFTLEQIDMKGVPQYDSLATWNDKPFNKEVLKTMRVKPGGGMEGFFLAKLIKT